MKIHNLARTMPIGVAILTFVSLCVAAAAFNLPPAGIVSALANGTAEEGISTIFTPSVQAWRADIVRWAEGYGLDPNFVATVMQIESCGDPQAISRAGAQGLFQVMPFHFAAGEDMQDADTNAKRGLEYLSLSLLKADGEVTLALAGYNGGHGVIGWDSSQWPAETQRYAYWGAGIFTDARSGAAESPRLLEWLAAGGSWLCNSAG
jgi:soluble lytic murein transglycosylase-like protein